MPKIQTHQNRNTNLSILEKRDVHIFYGELKALKSLNLSSKALIVLTDDERVQHQKFRLQMDRDHYLFARFMIRSLLSHYSPAIEPHEWIFDKNAFGKPFIARPSLPIPLYFNVSHSGGVIACAISHIENIGIDVEAQTQKSDLRELAKANFSESEFAVIESASHENLKTKFLEFWTLKEAYVKAKAKGLSIPLDKFSFFIEGIEKTGISKKNEDVDRKIRVTFEAPLNDEPDRWTFLLRRPTESHQVAIAIERADSKIKEFFVYDIF